VKPQRGKPETGGTMDKVAIKEAATVIAALSKWEYWHGNKERSDDLNRVAAHLIMVERFSTDAERTAMGTYLRGAEKLVAYLTAQMEGSTWPE
jgi:hypothetical protein